MKKTIKMITLTSLFTFAMLGSAIADEASWDVVASPKAIAAAKAYSYDQDHLRAFASEAGADVIATPKALIAARNYHYDEAMMAQIGTERGYDYSSSYYERGNSKKEDSVATTKTDECGKKG